MDTIDAIENERVALQECLDLCKTQEARNRLGQFSTPTLLAEDILYYAVKLMQLEAKVSFLDPAIGTGSFYSALNKAVPISQIEKALGFEIDPHYGEPAISLWYEHKLSIVLGDYTRAKPKPDYNLIICNPPYVRHHYITGEDKAKLHQSVLSASGIDLSGLSGLYCYFMGLSHAWMAPGAIAGWLIPSEFMDVNYGKAIKQYLLKKVTLLHLHRFDPRDGQFADALVSSAIVWIKNESPPADHRVQFTFGGNLLRPLKSSVVSSEDLAAEPKWSRFPNSLVRRQKEHVRLADFFKVSRGIATGDNKFFILTEDEIAQKGLPIEEFCPILPSPRYLPQDLVEDQGDGSPNIEKRLFLLNTRMKENEIKKLYPQLFNYLESGKARGVHSRYLCSHRTLWYAQENRPAAPIVCTYLGRSDSKGGRPFRFILNRSRATVANVYLVMYPTSLMEKCIRKDPGLVQRVWSELNSLPPEALLGEGRVYGGGLHKLEPKELANLPADFILKLIGDNLWNATPTQLSLIA
jgi:predicted RNA methylase